MIWSFPPPRKKSGRWQKKWCQNFSPLPKKIPRGWKKIVPFLGEHFLRVKIWWSFLLQKCEGKGRGPPNITTTCYAYSGAWSSACPANKRCNLTVFFSKNVQRFGGFFLVGGFHVQLSRWSFSLSNKRSLHAWSTPCLWHMSLQRKCLILLQAPPFWLCQKPSCPSLLDGA